MLQRGTLALHCHYRRGQQMQMPYNSNSVKTPGFTAQTLSLPISSFN